MKHLLVLLLLPFPLAFPPALLLPAVPLLDDPLPRVELEELPADEDAVGVKKEAMWEGKYDSRSEIWNPRD
jgi:hypothetical protein